MNITIQYHQAPEGGRILWLVPEIGHAGILHAIDRLTPGQIARNIDRSFPHSYNYVRSLIADTGAVPQEMVYLPARREAVYDESDDGFEDYQTATCHIAAGRPRRAEYFLRLALEKAEACDSPAAPEIDDLLMALTVREPASPLSFPDAVEAGDLAARRRNTA